MRVEIILEPNLSVSQITELGLMAEDAGISGIWVQNYSRAIDPFMSIVPLALASKRIRLGVVVVSPQELHPLKLANCALTLNELSDGRAAVVIGRGGDWLNVIGGDFSPRVEALRDALTIVTMAGRQPHDAPWGYNGESYSAQHYSSPWITAGAWPDVYAGVTLDRMLSMASETADGVMLADLGLPRVVADRISLVNSRLSEVGRSRAEFRISNFVGWHVKDDKESTYFEARRELFIRAALSPKWLEPFMTKQEIQIVSSKKFAFIKAYNSRSGVIDGVSEEIIHKLIHGLTITAPKRELDTALEKVAEYRESGLDELALRIHDDPDKSIRLIGDAVVPMLA